MLSKFTIITIIAGLLFPLVTFGAVWDKCFIPWESIESIIALGIGFVLISKSRKLINFKNNFLHVGITLGTLLWSLYIHFQNDLTWHFQNELIIELNDKGFSTTDYWVTLLGIAWLPFAVEIVILWLYLKKHKLLKHETN